MVQPLWQTVWQLLTNLNPCLPCQPAIPLLGIYSREVKTYFHTKTCSQMLIVLIHNLKNWSNLNVLELVNGFTNCGPSIQWNSCNGILLSTKSEQTANTHTMRESQIVQVKEARFRRSQLYYSINMKFWKR